MSFLVSFIPLTHSLTFLPKSDPRTTTFLDTIPVVEWPRLHPTIRREPEARSGRHPSSFWASCRPPAPPFSAKFVPSLASTWLSWSDSISTTAKKGLATCSVPPLLAPQPAPPGFGLPPNCTANRFMAPGTNVEVRPEGLLPSFTNVAFIYLWYSLPSDAMHLCRQNSEALIFESNIDYVDFRSLACVNLDIASQDDFAMVSLFSVCEPRTMASRL